MTTRVEDGKTPRFQDGGLLNDSVSFDTVDSDTTTNTFGAYVELSSDVGDRDVYLTNLLWRSTVTVNSVLELAVGGSGVEVPLVLASAAFVSTEHLVKDINLNNVRVPANSRVTARVKDEGSGVKTYLVNCAFNR